MNERVELGTVLTAIRARLGWVILIVLIAIAAGYAVTSQMPKVYAATTSVLVGKTTESANLTREDILASQDVAATYADLARREPVLAPVAKQLGITTGWLELRERVLVNVAPGNSQLIVVTAYADSTREATQIARSVTDQLIALAPSRTIDANVAFLQTQVQQLQEEIQRRQTELADVITQQAQTSAEQDALALRNRADTLLKQITDLQNNYAALRNLVPSAGGANALTVLEPASAAPAPVRPNLSVNLLISALLGMLLAAGRAYYLESHERRPRRRKKSSDGLTPHHVTQQGTEFVPRPERTSEFASLTGAHAQPAGRGAGLGSSSAATNIQER